MTTLLIVLILAVFVAALYVFYRMQQKHVKFSTRVFTALFAGIIVAIDLWHRGHGSY